MLATVGLLLLTVDLIVVYELAADLMSVSVAKYKFWTPVSFLADRIGIVKCEARQHIAGYRAKEPP